MVDRQPGIREGGKVADHPGVELRVPMEGARLRGVGAVGLVAEAANGGQVRAVPDRVPGLADEGGGGVIL